MLTRLCATPVVLPSIPISGFVALSSQFENCGGTVSTTMAGLYDVDGDGKQELVAAVRDDEKARTELWLVR